MGDFGSSLKRGSEEKERGAVIPALRHAQSRRTSGCIFLMSFHFGEGRATMHWKEHWAVLEDWALVPTLLCVLTDAGWVTSALWARVSCVKAEVGSQMMLSGPLNTALGLETAHPALCSPAHSHLLILLE